MSVNLFWPRAKVEGWIVRGEGGGATAGGFAAIVGGVV